MSTSKTSVISPTHSCISISTCAICTFNSSKQRLGHCSMSGWLIMFFEWRTGFSNWLPKVELLVSLTPCSLTETRKKSTRNRHAFSTWFSRGCRLFLGSPAAIPGRSVMTPNPHVFHSIRVNFIHLFFHSLINHHSFWIASGFINMFLSKEVFLCSNLPPPVKPKVTLQTSASVQTVFC